MNEQLQKALTELLNKVTTSLEDLSGKLPELVSQLIGYNIVKEWIYTGLLLALFSVFVFLSVWAFRVLQKFERSVKTQDDEESPWSVLFIMVFFSVAIFIIMAFQIVELVKLYCFPMVWVLDYLKETIK